MIKNRLTSLLSLLIICLTASAQIKDSDPIFKFVRAQAAIRQLYVDSVDSDRLMEDAIRGMLEKLDPHSTYSTAKEVKQMMASLQGNFEGVGIQYNIVDDTILVVQPVAKGPSERAGMLAGDRIVRINDSIVAGVKITTDQVVSRLRGKKGTTVSMTVKREGVADSIVFTVKRDKIPVFSVNAAFMLNAEVGLIRIDNFSATTVDEFSAAIEKLRREGMKHLILDLQSNGGGYLTAAVGVANNFLQQGDLIVYTDGRTVAGDRYKADGRGGMVDCKLVVLIDDYSASASEIVAGALQDHDRAVIVGRRSFGKGLVQRPIELPDGSMIRLTTSHYYTPSGRCIQKPYEKGKKKDYAKDIEERLKRGELTSVDSIHFADSLKFKTLKRGRTVYGGGGIMPDVFVPLDTTYNTRYYRQLVAKGCVAPTILKYTVSHRAELLKKYPEKTSKSGRKTSGVELFKEKFTAPDELINSIIAAGDKKNIKPKDDNERLLTLTMLRRQAKALIARDLWDMSEYFQVYADYDDIIQRGLKEITQE